MEFWIWFAIYYAIGLILITGMWRFFMEHWPSMREEYAIVAALALVWPMIPLGSLLGHMIKAAKERQGIDD